MGVRTRDCAVMMFFNIAFVFWTMVSLADSQTGSCQVWSTIRGETAGGGGARLRREGELFSPDGKVRLLIQAMSFMAKFDF